MKNESTEKPTTRKRRGGTLLPTSSVASLLGVSLVLGNCEFLKRQQKLRGASHAFLQFETLQGRCFCRCRFMLLAIGNAAWPMGVTMVGIHERAGRTKVFSSQIAHILNDETTRKYIQMIKRLMSFCQRTFKADPSQTILLSVHHV